MESNNNQNEVQHLSLKLKVIKVKKFEILTCIIELKDRRSKHDDIFIEQYFLQNEDEDGLTLKKLECAS